MPNYKKSAALSLWVTRVFLLVLAASLFLMPAFVRWYTELRALAEQAAAVLLGAFYVCTVPAALALFAIHRLLRNIQRDRVFLMDNARLVSHVGLCCAAVCLVTGAAGFVYPPLLFVSLLMLFLCLLMNVISSVLSAATQLREENDLTI